MVKFLPASDAEAQNQSVLLSNLVDPTFTYSNYSQVSVIQLMSLPTAFLSAFQHDGGAIT